MQDPRRPVPPEELRGLRDRDAAENYELVLRFRARLLAAGTVEGAYAGLFKGAVDIPPLFLEQMAHVVLRNILDGCEDPLRLRAAELFFREQKATIQDGHVLLADLETVEMHASGSKYGSLGRLIVEAQGATAKADLDVLDRQNAALYWERESRHDTVISLTYGRPVLDGFCRAMEAWIFHFMNARVGIRPIRHIEEPRWAWHIGLDAESTAILNALWAGEEVEAGRMRRILALFRMDFEKPEEMRRDIAGRSVYLALAADGDDVVKMKPQNLILNLPLSRSE
jgi:plasmid stability protein